MVPLRAVLALLALTGFAGCAMQQGEPAELMSWPDLLDRPRPAPSQSISYGADAYQIADLWLPAGRGPHRVVLMVHGGCWQTGIADRNIMNWIAADLQSRGFAVWNIDYRGVDRTGGGYPGTFLDAAAAADALRGAARTYNLSLDRIVATGHSAGGHLALWLAGRPRLPADSPLRSENPLPIRSVVSLGGLPDLEEAARPPGSGCGTAIVRQLTGGRFADTSVPRLAPLGIRQILVNGRQDRIIPTDYATKYASAMRSAGDEVTVRFVDRTGHVELIAPESAAWAQAVEAISRAFE